MTSGSTYRKLLLTLACCLVFIFSVGQDKAQVDSLTRLLNHAADTKSKVQILLSLANALIPTNHDQAFKYAHQATDLATESGDHEQLVTALLSESILYYSVSDLKNAMDMCLKAKELSERYDNKQGLAFALDGIGMIYYDIGDKKKCSENYFASLKYFESVNYKEGMSRTLSRIGVLYLDQKDFKTALSYFNRSLVLAKELGNQDGISSILNNIANVYIGMNENIKALKYLAEALKISKNNQNIYIQATNYVNIGKVNYNLKNYLEALKYYEKALAIFDTLNSLNKKSSCLVKMGEAELALQDYDNSLKYAHSAYDIGTSNGLKQIIYESAKLMHQIYIAKNDIQSAYKYTILEIQWKDSLALNEKEKNLASLELQYHFEKKEQLETASRQRRTLLAIGIIAFLILGIIIILLILNQLRLKAKKSILQKESLEKELDFKKKEITLNVLSLMKKNEMLTDISKKIIHIQEESPHAETRDALRRVGKELEKSSEDEMLKEFTLRFKEVHKEFYDELIKKFPDLTPSELKLCAFLKLNMTTKEISELTGQRLNTLENARYRLRQKLGISNSDVNLVTFLAQI